MTLKICNRKKKLGGPRLNGATPGGSEAGKRVSNGTVETMLNHKVGIMKHNLNIIYDDLPKEGHVEGS